MSDQNQIEPSRPFEEVHEFQGVLTKGERSIADQHFIVRYSTRRPGPIHGRILGEGSRATGERFSSLMRQSGLYSAIRSKAEGADEPVLESQRVRLRSSTTRFWPDSYTPSMVGVLAVLELDEFKVSTAFQREEPKRQISFSLAGPRDFWDLSCIRERSFIGSTRIEPRSIRIQDPKDELSVKLTPHFVYSTVVLEDGHRVPVEDSFDSLIIETEFSCDVLDDEQFRSRAIAIADDIMLLASIGARRKLDWFSYGFGATDRFEEYVRTRLDRFEDSVGPQDPLVTRAEVEEFLSKTLAAYRHHQDQGFDLRWPLITTLTAHTSDLLEQRFLFLFMALEKLKDMYASREKAYSNFRTHSERKRTLHNLSEYISSKLKDHPNVEDIKEKLPELGRRPLWSILRELLSTYDVEWRDVYPEGTDKPTFIAVRNKLLHTAEEVDLGDLFYETERLQVVLERLLLKLLGWEDTFGAASVSDAEHLAKGPTAANVEVFD